MSHAPTFLQHPLASRSNPSLANLLHPLPSSKMAPKTSKTAPVAKAGAKTAAKAAAKAAPKTAPKAGAPKAGAKAAPASGQKRKADSTPTPEDIKHRQQVFLTYLRDNMTKCKNAQKAEEAKNVYERYRANTDPEAKREMVNSFWLAGGKVKGLQVLSGHTPPPFPFFGVWVGFFCMHVGGVWANFCMGHAGKHGCCRHVACMPRVRCQIFACMPMLHAGRLHACCPLYPCPHPQVLYEQSMETSKDDTEKGWCGWATVGTICRLWDVSGSASTISMVFPKTLAPQLPQPPTKRTKKKKTQVVSLLPSQQATAPSTKSPP